MVVRAYYWKTIPNFGDLLTPLLLKRFAQINTVWAKPEESDIVVAGSVIDVLPPDWRGIIAGAGKLHENSKIPVTSRILALRGPLSARGVKGDFVLGDPGLLADELVPLPEKKYNLGIVPHWTDKDLENDPRFKKYNPKIIRVREDPLEVIRQIGECRKIVSSSLHGIILADAFGIPRRIEIAPRMLSHPQQEGGLFKWHDYSASLGMALEIGLTQEVDRNVVMEKQHEIFDIFLEIKEAYS